MTWLPTVRLVTFATVSLFAIVTMALSAALISLLNEPVLRVMALSEPDLDSKFAALALATSALTLITVIPMYFVDIARKGIVVSYIIVEIGWLSILWVLWLSSGAYAAWTNDQIFFGYYGPGCDFGLGDKNLTRSCQETKAIAGFSLITWIILMAYTGALLFLAIRAQKRGNPVWKASVREDTLLNQEAKSGGSPAQVPAVPASDPRSHSPDQVPTVPASDPQSYPPAPAPRSAQV